MKKPLCFVLMPFGKKAVGGTTPIDFDAVYKHLISPAIIAAGLEPLRADEEDAGGIIHKAMFERLVLCDYAVADLTAANANVFYELGVRHAAKPRTTVLMFAEGHGRLPFDVAQLRALPYEVGRKGTPKKERETIETLTTKLLAAKTGSDHDSPLYQLLDSYPDIDHEKTDVFRERVAYASDIKSQLLTARSSKKIDEVKLVEDSIGSIADMEAGVVIDLFLSYRAVEAWDDMIRVRGSMNVIIANTVLVREQLGLALNRAGRGEEAEDVLKKLIEERGPSSETYGILGRVYKDRWASALKAGETEKAPGYLRKAINAYTSGFEADWRDAYPGVNALTLGTILDPQSDTVGRLLPVVRYSVERRVAAGDPDYWDHATLLELAVIEGDEKRAKEHMSDALSNVREVWEPRTTAKNLKIIYDELSNEDPRRGWLDRIIHVLGK